jgi:hypothetical protein
MSNTRIKLESNRDMAGTRSTWVGLEFFLREHPLVKLQKIPQNFWE